MANTETNLFDLYMQLKINDEKGVILKKREKGQGFIENITEEEIIYQLLNARMLLTSGNKISVLGEDRIDFFWVEEKVIQCFREENCFYLHCENYYFSIDFKNNYRKVRAADIYCHFIDKYNPQRLVISKYKPKAGVFNKLMASDLDSIGLSEYIEMSVLDLERRIPINNKQLVIESPIAQESKLSVKLKEIKGFPDNTIDHVGIEDEIYMKNGILFFQSFIGIVYMIEAIVDAQ